MGHGRLIWTNTKKGIETKTWHQVIPKPSFELQIKIKPSASSKCVLHVHIYRYMYTTYVYIYMIIYGYMNNKKHIHVLYVFEDKIFPKALWCFTATNFTPCYAWQKFQTNQGRGSLEKCMGFCLENHRIEWIRMDPGRVSGWLTLVINVGGSIS